MATYIVNCRHLWNQTLAEAASCLGQKSDVAGYIQSMENRLLRYGYLHPPSKLVNPENSGKRKKKKKGNFYDVEDPFIDNIGEWNVSKNEQDLIDELESKRRGVRKKIQISRQDTEYIITSPCVQMDTRRFRIELALHRRMESSHDMNILVRQVRKLDSGAFRQLLGEELRKGYWQRRPVSRVVHVTNFTADGLFICQGIEQEFREWYIAQSGQSVEGWDIAAAAERTMLLEKLPRPLTRSQMWACVAENMVITAAHKQKLKFQGWAPPNMPECHCRYHFESCASSAQVAIDSWLNDLEDVRRQKRRNELASNMVPVYDSDDDMHIPIEDDMENGAPIKNGPDSGAPIAEAADHTKNETPAPLEDVIEIMPPTADPAPLEDICGNPFPQENVTASELLDDMQPPFADTTAPAPLADVLLPREETTTGPPPLEDAPLALDDRSATPQPAESTALVQVDETPANSNRGSCIEDVKKDEVGDGGTAMVAYDNDVVRGWAGIVEWDSDATKPMYDNLEACEARAKRAAEERAAARKEQPQPLCDAPAAAPTSVVLATPTLSTTKPCVATPCLVVRPPKPPTFVDASFLLGKVMRMFTKSLTDVLLQGTFSTMVRKLYRKKRAEKWRDIVDVKESSEDELIVVDEKNTPAGRYESYMAQAMQVAMQAARMPQNPHHVTPPPAPLPYWTASGKRPKKKKHRDDEGRKKRRRSAGSGDAPGVLMNVDVDSEPGVLMDAAP